VSQHRKRCRVLRLGLRALLVALLCAPIVLAYLIVDDTRLIIEAKPLEPDDAARAKRLVKKTWTGLRSATDTTTISASDADLNSLMAVVARGLPNAAVRANITSRGLESALSIQLPSNPLGDYMNLRIGLAASSNGLSITHATVGSLRFPGWLASATLRAVLNLALGGGQGKTILDAVQSVTMSPDTVTVSLRPIPGLKEGLERFAGRAKAVRDKLGLLVDPAAVRVYYLKLIEVGRALRAQDNVSLGVFTQPVFRLACQRSKRSDVLDENRAAILALAMYLGDTRFEKFIGPVRTDEMRAQSPLPDNVVLAGRHDLRLHFIISAALELLSDRGITHAIGEFKELLDTDSRGSGFSFVDLAADRAGVVFSEIATHRRDTASRLQRLLAASGSEDLFFPSVAELPEGISRAEFAQRYSNTDSVAYRTLVAEVDRRVAMLPAYSAWP
jgi:hypothetical protein